MKTLKTAALLFVLLFALQGCFWVVDHDGYRHHHYRGWWHHSSLEQDSQPTSHDVLAQNAVNALETGKNNRN